MKKYLFFGAIAAYLLTGCFSSYTGDEAVISLNFGAGTGIGRAVIIDKWNPERNPDIKDKLKFEIILSGPGGNIPFTANYGEDIKKSVIPGTWTIDIKAYVNGERYGKGNETIELEAGQNKDVTVNLSPYYYEIGDIGPAGGVIFYRASVSETDTSFDNEGFTLEGSSGRFHYLELAPASTEIELPWGENIDYLQNSANFSSGLQNTLNIIDNYNGTNTIAAQYCRNLNVNGYTDWFLPSHYMLYTYSYDPSAFLMSVYDLYLKGLGDLAENGVYMSSSDTNQSVTGGFNFNYAMALSLSPLDTVFLEKDVPAIVRAVRAF